MLEPMQQPDLFGLSLPVCGFQVYRPLEQLATPIGAGPAHANAN